MAKNTTGKATPRKGTPRAKAQKPSRGSRLVRTPAPAKAPSSSSGPTPRPKAKLPFTVSRSRRQVSTADVLQIALRVAAGLVALAVIGAISFFVLRNTSMFTIVSIDAEPTEHLAAEDISVLADIEAGTTLLTVDTDQVAENIRKNPWVADVSVSREFPDRLGISITERRVDALVLMGTGSLAWFVGEGRVWLEPTNIEPGEGQSVNAAALEVATSRGAILVTDVPANIEPQAGAVAEAEVLDAVMQYREQLSAEFAAQVVSFSAPSVEGISCVLTNGVEVSLGGPTNIESKEAVVTELLETYPGELTYINVRVPSNPSYRRIDSSTVQPGTGAMG